AQVPPVPARGRGGSPAALAPPPHQPPPPATGHHRPDHRTTRGPRGQRHRSRPAHHRLAPATPPPPGRVTGLHPPPSTRSRADHPDAAEAAQILLHPVRRRATQRTLAGRLHPLVAGRRHPCGDP